MVYLQRKSFVRVMKKLVGRYNEIQLLEEFAVSQTPQFVAIYGRRRVGKTFLVNQLFQNRFSFSVTGVLDGNYENQMTSFVEALKDFGADISDTPKDWMNAFIMLKDLLKPKISDDKPCIIFIDELPCFDTQRSGFTNALGYFWNSWASLQKNLLLIVCGSATSWMIKNIIDNKGGLHDRISYEMHLRPFTLKETEDLLISNDFQWDRDSITQAYMALGGIPYYLCLLKKDESFAQNIDRLFFSQDPSLRREYKRLYSTLFNSPDKYCAIVEALAKDKKGLTRDEIAQKLKMESSGSLSAKLEDLINCDIIRKYNVRGKKVKTSTSIYQLIDFFSMFYLTFAQRGEVEIDYWQNHLDTPQTNTWLGLAFEKVCLAHIQQIKKALKIDGISTQSYSWRSKNTETKAQVDLIIERADRKVNLCEIKYSSTKYLIRKAESEKMQNRIASFKEETAYPYAVWLTMITPYGLAESMYNNKVVKSITIDDLFE